MSDDLKNSNVVRLADRRKRGSAIHRKGATGQKKEATPRKVWAVLQLGLFLALVAYFIRSC